MDKSFKNNVIAEAIGIKTKNACCKTAFLCAMLKTVGAIEVSRKGAQAYFASDNYDLIALIAQDIKDLYLTDVEIERSKYTSGVKKGSLRFELRVPKGQTKSLVADTKTMTVDGENFTGFVEGIPPETVGRECCAKAFIRGMLIGCGSVYVPSLDEEGGSEGGYHLEFQLSDERTANDLARLLSTFQISAKLSERGANFLVYVKDKTTILSIFQFLGLPEATIKIKDIMRERELNGSINRTVICEAANLDKTYTASALHLKAIQIIEKRDGLDSLPSALKETALARIANPRQTLQELADLIGVTKSCFNHRMRKLLLLAGLGTEEKDNE